MLFKLLKYDFRAMWKQFSLIWGAALALALVNRMTHSLPFMIRAGDHDGNIGGFTMDILLIVFVVMFVICISFVTRRFSQGLLGNEGYLMHTLPVRAWQLVLSKLICAIAACVASTAAVFLSLFLMVPTEWKEIFQIPLWVDIFQGLAKHMETVVILLEFCLLMLSLTIEFIASVYLAISIGHLFTRRQKLAGVASFIGLYVLVFNVYARLFDWDAFLHAVEAATETVHGSLLSCSAFMLAPAAVFLLAVCWILDNKLNLE